MEYDMKKETNDNSLRPTWWERVDRWASSDAGSWTMTVVFGLLMAAAFFFGEG